MCAFHGADNIYHLQVLFDFYFRKLQDVRDKLESLKELFEEQQVRLDSVSFKFV